MTRFGRHMISENVQAFWAALQRGEFITDAAVKAGTYRKQGTRWVIAHRGVRPRFLMSKRLSRHTTYRSSWRNLVAALPVRK